MHRYCVVPQTIYTSPQNHWPHPTRNSYPSVGVEGGEDGEILELHILYNSTITTYWLKFGRAGFVGALATV